ncbi:hypothetical protein Dimus_021564, partial [Dionaea muscipula]
DGYQSDLGSKSGSPNPKSVPIPIPVFSSSIPTPNGERGSVRKFGKSNSSNGIDCPRQWYLVVGCGSWSFFLSAFTVVVMVGRLTICCCSWATSCSTSFGDSVVDVGNSNLYTLIKANLLLFMPWAEKLCHP